MTDALVIALAQLNPTVGDIAGQPREDSRRPRRVRRGCDLLVCSELALIGYPPEDLVLRPAVIEATRRAVDELAGDTRTGPAILVTTPWRDGDVIYNAAVLLDGGSIGAVRYKHELPNYGVFDEKRVFAAGPLPDPVDFRGVRLGVLICEDMWYPKVAAHLAKQGAELLIVPNGSPFEREQGRAAHRAVDRSRARDRAAARLRQPGRRPGRARVRRRVVRDQCRRTARRAAAGLDRDDARHALDPRRAADGRASRSRWRRCRTSRATPTRR